MRPVSPTADPRRVNVLGVGVSAISMAEALATIERWVATREQHYVCVTGVHGVMESQRDESLRRIHNAAGLVTPDGMPLVWLGRRLSGRRVERVYGPDLLPACCAALAPFGVRHFFYGGGDGVAELLARRLCQAVPGFVVAGTYAPPFRALTPAEDAEVVRRIDESGTDIVWVGLSTPKQERWMAAHAGALQAPVMVGVGAAFDFVAGCKRQAPRWIQHSGFEWLYRLAIEPRRLWKRYLRNNPEFAWRLLLQATGLVHHDLATSTGGV